MRGFIGLGSNRGARQAYLERGLRGLVRAGGQILETSSMWQNPPVEGVLGGLFLNAVVAIEGPADPDWWLKNCLKVEQEQGRLRPEPRLSRTLDLDVLWLDGLRIASPQFQVPHPRAFRRSFVVLPWMELKTALTDPALSSRLEEAKSSQNFETAELLRWGSFNPERLQVGVLAADRMPPL